MRKKNNINNARKSASLQERRYEYDFCIVPSIFAHSFMQMFVPDDDKVGPLRKVGLVDEDLKELCEIENNSSVRMLDVNEGQLSVLRFPSCDFSPSVVYGIGIYKSADFEMAKSKKLDYRAPYYALIKGLDKYVIGQISYSTAYDNYSVSYMEQQDSADLHQFIKWVMKKENLSPVNEWDDFYKGIVTQQ